jgi:CRISPR system Cascade subunit CasA
MSEFNLLDEKWIVCTDLNGHYQEISIRDLICNAHSLRQFSHAYAIVNASYFFLIEALLLRVFSKACIKLDDPDEWYAIFASGRFDETLFEDYFKSWHHRFFLFDESHPFFQDTTYDENYLGTAMKLMPHYSGGTGGNTATLFDHHTEADGISFSMKEAANFLLPAYYYGAGGRIIGSDYFSDAITANGLSFFIGGENLFETLVLNLLPYPPGNFYDVAWKDQDRPIWEQEQPFDSGNRDFQKENNNTLYQPYGPVDLLTWPGRKIRLIKEEDETVRNIQMRAGLKINQPYFPWFAYNRKGNYVRAQKERAVWRNFDVLVQLQSLVTGSDANIPPFPVQWLSILIREDHLTDRIFDLYSLGMSKEAGKQKAYFYSSEKLPLPAEYFVNQDLIKDISDELMRAEDIRRTLYGATAAIATTILSFESDRAEGKQVDPKDKNNLVNHLGAESVYWTQLESAFYTLVINLPQEKAASIYAWKKAVQEAARQALDHAIRLAGESVACLKASVKARTILEKGLKEHLGEFEKEVIHE